MKKSADGKTSLLVEDEALIALAEKMVPKRVGHAFTTPDNIDLILMAFDPGPGILGTVSPGILRFALALTLMFTVAGLSAQVGDDWPGRDLFENHGVIKLIIDPADGAIVAANAAAREFYGYPSLLEVRVGEINLLTEREVAEELRRAAVEERNYFLFRHATETAGVRDVEVYSYPVTIGEKTYLYSIIIDITERVFAEKQLRVSGIRSAVAAGAAIVAGVLALILWTMRIRSRLHATRTALATTEEVYRSYVNGAPLGVFVVDQTGRYREVNPEACRITGYSEEDLLGMTITEIVIPAHRSDAEKHFRTLLTAGRSAGEMAFSTRSGEIRWWNVVATAISPDRFLGFAEDITDRKTAEEAGLRLVEVSTELQSFTPETVDFTRIAETARALSGAAFAALNLFDPNGRSFTTVAVAGIPDLIRRAAGFLGFPLVGRRWDPDPVREAALGTDRTVISPSLGSLTSSGFAPSIADGIARTFDLGEVVVTRIQNTTGTLGDFTLLYARDQHLSNRDQLELFAGMVGVTLARLRTEEQNARLVQEKETLLKEVHHRIKNNMNTMTSLLSLQAHQVRGTRVAEEILNDVRSRFRSMEILYDRLYRSDAFGSSSMTEYLQTLVRQVADLFPAAPRVTVTVDSGGEAASQERCVLDAKRLSTVGLIVNELVTNAMKYAFSPDRRSGDPGSVRGALVVTVACRDGSVEICVQDDGPGLPEDFDPENSGGFGTTMVQAMVAQLHGTIRYESSHAADNHGTRVVLEFPQT